MRNDPKQSLVVVAVLALGSYGCGDGGQQIAAPSPRSEVGEQLADFDFPGYNVVISNGHPFGIVSLRAADQVSAFSHGNLPLGDWEWFWLEKPDTSSRDRDVRVKLIDPEWTLPIVTFDGDTTSVVYWRDDVLYPGVRLGVEYHLFADQAAFDVHYTIHNDADSALVDPYVMVGFPGFLDNERIVSVGTLGLQDRPVAQPHATFREQALARGGDELLQRSVDRARSADPGRFAASVSVHEGGKIFTLTSRFESDLSYPYVFSAHTNKPDYLTSHIYAYMEDIPQGVTKRLVVHHSLSVR